MLYLALEPRSGKTPISLNIIQNTYADAKVLFVTTKSAIDGIHKVYEDFEFTLDVYVINYESLHKIKDTYTHIIIDEAHKNISKFPKPSKSHKELKRLISNDTRVIWLSGTTHIESSSQLYHQLSLSPFHSFNKYKDFYSWFYPEEHYKVKRKCGGYGIPATKNIGYGKEATDYSNTVDFSDQFNPIMIKYVMDEVIRPKIVIKHTQMTTRQSRLYHEMKSTGVTINPASIAANGAGRLSKLQQIAGGSLITDEGIYIMSDAKAKLIKQDHPNVPIFYKYVGEQVIMQGLGVDQSLLYQIDSKNTGLDLSQYDSMVIYSLTFSGANWSQVLARLINTERTTPATIYVYLVDDTIDKEIYERVSTKRDMNSQFLRS